MGLLSMFGGKSAEDYERQGDALASDNAWGDAKLAFESALEKSEKQTPPDPVMHHRVQQKLRHCMEALAKAQHQEALELVEAGCVEDALELFGLARELTADPQFKEEIAQHIESAHQASLGEQGHAITIQPPSPEPEADVVFDDPDDYFDVLMGALPEDVQQAYSSYGYHFKQGYVALNQGAFDLAVEHLLQAHEDNSSSNSLVPLELATAYVNLGASDKALPLLEDLVQHQPDCLPAIQLLCEIYWEAKAFDQAMQLLDSLSPDVAQSLDAYMLRGETLLQSNRIEEAQSYFQDLLNTYGWNDTLALGMAKAHEALDQITQALDVYGKIISECTGCGTRVDPWIKRKYTDLSFEAGDRSTKVLENYLALTQEDPAHAVHYCQNISRIYQFQGNEAEAQRFQALAKEMKK